jgi:hypothetical protein
MPGKRLQFDEATWNAVDLLSKDTLKDLQELAEEAFADLLKKHNRPTDLKSALRKSLIGGNEAARVNAGKPSTRRARKKPGNR